MSLGNCFRTFALKITYLKRKNVYNRLPFDTVAVQRVNRGLPPTLESVRCRLAQHGCFLSSP